MSTLICNGTGNLTGSTTFAAADTATGALALVRFNITTWAAATTSTSSSFTVTSGKVIDAVMLWVFMSSPSPTGTFKVDLQKGGVSQASVTVNKTDLPDSTNLTPVPVLFKLGSTATGDGGSNWTIVVTTTGTSTITYNRNSATAADFTRALRTTTAATAVAGDDLYIIGELTGAGTNTARTVTMDSTAATAYGSGLVNSTTVSGGGIRISNYGTLTYGTSASTNYVLRVNGDVEIFQFGTVNIGASGAEIPRSSTAVLELQQTAATNDFGLIIRNNGVWNAAGLSRTSGKDIYQCKLTADLTSSNIITAAASFSAGSVTANIGANETGSMTALEYKDNITSTNHYAFFTLGSVPASTTQTAVFWIAGGSGTNNRYVRVTMGNSTTFTSVVNGFYVDIDLQAGTVGTVTARGNGTATSVSIVAVGGGYVVRMVGKISSSTATSALFFNACAVSGTTSYAGTTTQCFVVNHVNVINSTVSTDTSISVDTDTGWLNGDAICVAATTRNALQCENFLLNTDATSTTLVSSVYPGGLASQALGTFTHNGTSPVQAEVGLLTRNVKIRSTTLSRWAYVYCEPLATVNASRVEFYYLGASTLNKRGIETKDGATTNLRSFTYCSFHDCYTAFQLNVGGLASVGVIFSNNIVWNTTGNAVMMASLTGTDWTLDNNLIIAPGLSGFYLADFSGTCTNNTVAGAGSGGAGFVFSSASLAAAIGTFNNNTTHSNISYGLLVNSIPAGGVVNNFTCWRTTSYGVYYSNAFATIDLVLNNLILFGNSGTSNMYLASSNDGINITGNSVIAADTSFPVSTGITFSNQIAMLVNISGLDMSGNTGILAPHTIQDYLFGSVTSPNTVKGTINNCKFGSSTLPIPNTQKVYWTKDSYIGFEKFNQTAGDHRTEMTYGQLKTDTGIYHTASPSMRMTPISASNKLESAPKNKGILVAVASGASVDVSVYLRKAIATDLGPSPFNSADKTATATLTNNDLTVTSSGFQAGVRSVRSVASGKWYVEFTAGATVGSGSYGATRSSDSLVSLSGNTSGFTLILSTGDIYFYGVNLGKNIGVVNAGDVIGMALNTTTNRAWFRKNGGNWNGDPTADPATGIGGVDTSAVFAAAPAFFYFGINTNGASATVNVGDTSFANAAPTGYSAWGTGDLYQGNQPRLIQRANPALGQNSDVVLATYSAGAGSWNQLTATSSTATDDGAWEFVVDCDGNTGFINVDDWSA